ncbi:MAG: sensor domain-containing diguanylate cyclase, partial [Candidatus Omnitrophota bacterium]|nr:sensor domain-containing diguanylate cyclase [Candidatus Omnitrophota bacterium]
MTVTINLTIIGYCSILHIAMEKDLQKECLRVQRELAMLYEIGNAMHTTLNLDEILYIILTAVTSHIGLGFNRSMLFLVNENEKQLEGKMGIGPDSAEDANQVWTHIEKHKLGFDELIQTHSQFEHRKKSRLDKIVKSIKIPINKDSGIMALTAMKGTTFVINSKSESKKVKDEFTKILNLEEFVTVPLKARDKVIGVIVADNLFTNRPISEDEIRILTMFTNQAGLAIENSRLYENTVLLSNSDSLTGLWHHGYFQYLLALEIQRSSATKQPFTILMIDIDNFKKFNDTNGHQAGDAIIKTISGIFAEASRKIDIIARYGGEEFSIILPNSRKSEAGVLAERLRKAVEQNPGMKKMTISIGVASFPDDGETKEELISKADRALYEAKRTGKN